MDELFHGYGAGWLATSEELQLMLKWGSLTSGIPSGVYIGTDAGQYLYNDIDSGFECSLSRFAVAPS